MGLYTEKRDQLIEKIKVLEKRIASDTAKKKSLEEKLKEATRLAMAEEYNCKPRELDEIISSGDEIDAGIHRRLIMNLFFKNSPLHDGAMVIKNGRIAAARCTLPITQKTNIPANFGMRHKAAIGITEESDADVIVVSEETGNISFVKGGAVTKIQNINELKLLLGESLG
jgi:DNA integrity scanning protein DisA with diadenylate cyclase activity